LDGGVQRWKVAGHHAEGAGGGHTAGTFTQVIAKAIDRSN
jgi:hypothetical protein